MYSTPHGASYGATQVLYPANAAQPIRLHRGVNTYDPLDVKVGYHKTLAVSCSHSGGREDRNDKQTDRQTGRQTNIQTETDRQTDRQTDR